MNKRRWALAFLAWLALSVLAGIGEYKLLSHWR